MATRREVEEASHESAMPTGCACQGFAESSVEGAVQNEVGSRIEGEKEISHLLGGYFVNDLSFILINYPNIMVLIFLKPLLNEYFIFQLLIALNRLG